VPTTAKAVKDDLEQAISDAGLTDDEAATVREQVAGGGVASAAIAYALEHREEPEPTDPEAEPEIEPEAPAGKEPTGEQMARSLDRIVNNFEKALTKLFEPDEPLQRAETPGVLGFVLPGFNALKPNDKFVRCDTCNGHGKVLTGAVNQENALADCPRCAARGYLEKLEPIAQPQPQPVLTGPTAPVTPQTGNGQAEYGVPAWMGNPEVRPAT
jgi:hypothetical protein